MIAWPLLVKHPHDDHLLLLANLQLWLAELEINPSDEMMIIDSQGLSYCWRTTADGGEFVLANEPVPLAQLLDWIRTHASLNGHCCTAKIGANTIEQVFEIMRYLEES
ncbi:DUF4144 family protein [Shewanella colwelliana]|uniref:DUF4144 family protein n=1 Tax=Shewanella colwelliana TaxID=23 RepID=UPI0022AF2455|nr:DUF4144 family protein [Shewanella colwelliana]MCZ4335915.1 DUF4144 family protein [Shewanella colwelliana]